MVSHSIIQAFPGFIVKRHICLFCTCISWFDFKNNYQYHCRRVWLDVMRLKVRDERWAEARERSRAEQSESESESESRVQQYANEPNEENMRETPPYIGREARQMSEWEMHGWTGNARVNKKCSGEQPLHHIHTRSCTLYTVYSIVKR